MTAVEEALRRGIISDDGRVAKLRPYKLMNVSCHVRKTTKLIVLGIAMLTDVDNIIASKSDQRVFLAGKKVPECLKIRSTRFSRRT